MTIPDRGLLDWVDDADGEHGLYFAEPGGPWDYHSYRDLADTVRRAAAALHAAGIRRGEIVANIQQAGPGFVGGFFGALAAGATVCSLPPPLPFQDKHDYQQHVRHLLATARPALTVCGQQWCETVGAISRGLGLAAPHTLDSLTAGVAPAERTYAPADDALLQFTSGSTGFSRGVLVSESALRSNVTAMRRWLRWEPEQPGISWLPVYHDMGLTGALVNIVTTGCDGWLLQPSDFLRSPSRYLRCISENRVCLAVMPNFGLAYIVRRIKPSDIDGLRFDSLRSLILGAERIDPRVLRSFEDLLGPRGLRHEALLPAYGCAEATLAITGLPPGLGWSESAPTGGAGRQVVGCGHPLDGVTVRVVDDSGADAPDGTVGEVVVAGESLARGYAGDPGTASGTEFLAGLLHTGDAGFIRDGQLFVVGRFGDGLKVRGRMVFAESLEVALHAAGIPERRVAVLLGDRHGHPTGVAVMEKPDAEWQHVVYSVLREALDDAELLAVEVPRGGLAVTSSGKPRRRAMWRALCDGQLGGQVRCLAPAEGHLHPRLEECPPPDGRVPGLAELP